MAAQNPANKVLTPYLIVLPILLIVGFYVVSSYFANFLTKPTSSLSPKPVAQTIPGWKTFTEPKLGVSFQYPPEGIEYFGTNFSNQNALAPEAQIDLKMNCKDEVPSIFSVTRSSNPPIALVASKLTQKTQVAGIDGFETDNSDSGLLQISLQKDNYYYMLKFITCDSAVNQQILSTFQFL